MQLNDPNTLQLGLSNMESLAPTTKDMPVKAQQQLSQILERTTKVFYNISQGASREDSIASGTAVLEMALGILNVRLAKMTFNKCVLEQRKQSAYSRSVLALNENYRLIRKATITEFLQLHYGKK